MGFKAEHMKRLFNVWEDTWRQWIEPEPFKNFADPLPSFPGSKFCIEQYALGHALVLAEIVRRPLPPQTPSLRRHLALRAHRVMPYRARRTSWRSRAPTSSSTHATPTKRARRPPTAPTMPAMRTFFYLLPDGDASTCEADAECTRSGHGTGSGATGYGTTGGEAQRQAGASVLSGSTAYAGLPSSQFLATSAFLAFASASSSYGSSYLGSYPSSYLTSYPSSYWSSYSSYGVATGGTITYFGSTTTDLHQRNAAGQAGAAGFAPGTEGGQEGRHAYPDLPEHIAVRPYHTLPPQLYETEEEERRRADVLAALVVQMDNLGACVVHFYNSFYDAAHYWWTENEQSIVKALKPQ